MRSYSQLVVAIIRCHVHNTAQQQQQQQQQRSVQSIKAEGKNGCRLQGWRLDAGDSS